VSCKISKKLRQRLVLWNGALSRHERGSLKPPDETVDDDEVENSTTVHEAALSERAGSSDSTDTPLWYSAVLVALWGLVLVTTVVLAHQRYRGAIAGDNGGDFRIYFQAAQRLAAGHSPYQANDLYLYPPTIAMLLAPFSHHSSESALRVWTVMELAAFVVGVGAFVAIEASKLKTWFRPVLAFICIVTLFHFWPTTIDVSLGQADGFVFAALMLSGLAASRDWPATRGVLVGIAGLLKAWPAAVAVSFAQRGSQRKGREALALLLTLLLAPVLALVFGGGSGLVGFVKSVLGGRSQHIVSDSVWGAPSLLFSNSGLARPLVTSAALQVVSTSLLIIWVVGLLVVSVRTPGSKVMCTWNVMFCIVLLLPVSHLAYTVYALPVLWLWISGVFASDRRSWQRLVVPLLLVLWWVVVDRSWPDTGSSAAIGSIHYCVVFMANLLACTTSVVGWRLLAPPPTSGGEPTTGASRVAPAEVAHSQVG
jgi:hypothetical protein